MKARSADQKNRWSNSTFRSVSEPTAFRLFLNRWMPRSVLSVVVIALVVGTTGFHFLGQTAAQSLPENCFASPGACGYPDPNYNNDTGSTAVGVADCSALPDFSTANLPAGTYYSGSGDTLEITGNNVNISNLNMGSFGIYVSSGVNNFTFNNSCIKMGDGTENSSGIIVAAGATNTTIEDATISGAGTNVASYTNQSGSCVPGAGVSNGALGVAVNNNGTGTTINDLYTYDVGGGAPGAGGGTDTTVENSYELINIIPACEHDEAVYFSDGTITLHHNVLFNEEDQTAAVFGDTYTNGGACNNSLTMTDNFVAGGDYVVYPCGNAGSVGTSTMDVEGNRFARCLTTPLVDSNHECSGSGLNGSDSHGYYADGGSYGVASYYYSGTGQTWSGNYWDDSLDQVNIDSSSGPPVASIGPTVTVTGPRRGTNVNNVVTITATASTSSSATVHDVQFQIDGTDIPNCDPTSPVSGSTYECAWDTTSASGGNHAVQAVATDSNGQTATSSETVTVYNSPATTYSVWSSSDTPANPDTASDTSSIELGNKFQSNEAGYALGVRFYKGIDNAGIHTGSLWTSSGGLLASVTFANETPSGWQQAFFLSPVAISANTTYVISYYAPNGNYAADHNYFNSGATNGPLTALQNNDSNGDGGNGVYTYSASFPNQTYQATNYWVDAIFSTSQYIAPTVSFTAPSSGATAKGTEPITANIAGNAGATINDVQFQIDGTDIPNCDPTSPVSGSTYECSTWDTTEVGNGVHTVQVVATDSNGEGTTSGEAVTVDNPTPSVSISASPSLLTRGGSSKLTWSSSNATYCNASGAWSGSVTTSNVGGYTVTPPETSTYTLVCSGSGGISSPASVTVTVTVPSVTSASAPSQGDRKDSGATVASPYSNSSNSGVGNGSSSQSDNGATAQGTAPKSAPLNESIGTQGRVQHFTVWYQLQKLLKSPVTVTGLITIAMIGGVFMVLASVRHRRA